MVSKAKNKPGMVYLVGAGPGDPGLLTLKAKACLERADCVFYDHLVNPELLRHCPQARRYDVGKRSYRGHISQTKIEKLLIRAAHTHRVVVRLKGGDPFIFGRGGEEAEALHRARINFEIVPGVTSAVAVPAYAGIPLTHRNLGSSVAFVTGHEDPEKPKLSAKREENWQALAKIPTLVLLMGVKTLREKFSKLIQFGKDEDTPAAIIEWGTYPRQRSCTGTLKTLPALAKRKGIRAPAITVVGEVVRMKPHLDWFETKSLFGKRIVVTRASSGTSELSHRLREAGAEALELPALEIRPPRSWSEADRAIARLETYSWAIFTSVPAVEAFLKRLAKRRQGLTALQHLKIAAVGPATEQSLVKAGLKVSRRAGTYTSAALARTFSAREIKDKRLLWPLAETAGEELPTILRSKGAVLDCATVYRTELPRLSRRKILQALGGQVPNLLTFASGATAENFSRLIKKAGLWPMIQKIPAAAIGPVTRAAARRAGFKVVIMPKRHTIADLVAAISVYF